MLNLNKITEKFYKTEEERLEKISKNQGFIKSFVQDNRNFLLSLYNSGIQFHIFDFDKDKIHAGLFPCCNKRPQITDAIRSEAYSCLKTYGFNSIIWEDLI